MKAEIWKDIPNYEGHYQVSNLGNVRSLDRYVNGKKYKTYKKGVVLKTRNNKGYYDCVLCMNRKFKCYKVHQLVAMAFLNHKPCGHKLVVDHINNIKTDNRIENLQIITARENTTKDRKNTSSKYIGVSWMKRNKRWRAEIKKTYIGSFKTEIEANNACENKLKEQLKN